MLDLGLKAILALQAASRFVETKPENYKRIEEAAKFMPLEDLSLSPQCGFASTMVGNELTEEEQWAKMKLVAAVAKQVWGTTE